MLRPFLTLALLSLTDAWLTVAEASRAGLPVESIEGNPVMAYALAGWGVLGMLALKLLPLAVLGLLLAYQPFPRVVRALITVFVCLLGYHGLLLIGG